jgi:hypothetical protein
MSATTTPAQISLEALRWPTHGITYDLCSGYWPGMPLSTGHPPFQVITYRTPRGERNQRDLRFLDDNPKNFGFISELVMGTQHSGTHIDARGHITSGPDSQWWGGHSADTDLGDFGLLNNDAAELKPIFCRGYLLDVPAATGREHLNANEPIGAAELAKTADAHGIKIEDGAAIMVRTGMMKFWPDASALDAVQDAGVSRWRRVARGPVPGCGGCRYAGLRGRSFWRSRRTAAGPPLPAPRPGHPDHGVGLPRGAVARPRVRVPVRLYPPTDRGRHGLDGPAARDRVVLRVMPMRS